MTNDFQHDQNELLMTFLDKEVFVPEKDYLNSKTLLNPTWNFRLPGDKEGMAIELIVRPQCNQKCDYCYIYQHGTELYPIDERVDNATILANLKSFLDYVFIKRHTFINHFELFAGDLFYDGLFYDIMDVFYDCLKPLYITHRYLFDAPFTISVPCNCSFVEDEEKLSRFDACFNKMQEINCHINLSYSGDGKYAVDTREHRPLDDAYYEKMQNFLNKYQYLTHPMVSYENIKNWIKNYDWWIDFHKGLDFLDHTTFQQPFMLEVRNSGWTKTTIEQFTELLLHMYEVRKNFYHNDKVALANHIFNSPRGQNDLLRLAYKNEAEMNKYSCSLQRLLHVTLNNLSIVPCHRTSYPEFTIGHFTKDDNGIISGVKAKNISIGIITRYAKPRHFPKCSTCGINRLCYWGCLGANFEETGDLFMPPSSVCDLMHSKFMFLIELYKNEGLLDIALENNFITQEQYNVYMRIIDNHMDSLDKECPPIQVERSEAPCFQKAHN